MLEDVPVTGKHTGRRYRDQAVIAEIIRREPENCQESILDKEKDMS
jgi:hypothetical protein